MIENDSFLEMSIFIYLPISLCILVEIFWITTNDTIWKEIEKEGKGGMDATVEWMGSIYFQKIYHNRIRKTRRLD